MTKLISTVDQHKGNHHTGMRVMQLEEIRTDVSDYVPYGEWEALSPQEREDFEGTLETLHDLRVRVAELDYKPRAAVEEAIGDAQPEDIDALIAAYDAALDEHEESEED